MKNLVIRLALWIVIGLLGVWIYNIISDDIKRQKTKERVEGLRKKRLFKIREVQMLYKDEKGEFAGDWGQLLNFAKNGKLTMVKTTGDPRDTNVVTTMDTTYIPVKDSIFKKRFSLIDSLPFVPEANDPKTTFQLYAGDISLRGVRVKVFEVVDPVPLDDDAPLTMGSKHQATYDINR